jgi:hypothetical protein
VSVCLEVAAWSVFALQNTNADGRVWVQIQSVGTVPVLKYQKFPGTSYHSGEYARAIASHFNGEQTVF